MAREQWQRMEIALQDVGEERERQVTGEGYTEEHDDEHELGNLLSFARTRMFTADQTAVPWEVSRQLLVQAAAVLIAGIEKLDREAEKEASS